MFVLKAAFCRVFQMAFRIAMPVLPYRKPEILTSCNELGKVFKKENIKSVLIVTDKGIVANGLIDSYKVGAEKFIDAIIQLNKSMGIPDKIDCIRKEDIHIMAYHAEKEANPLYPVPKLMTKKELEKFYYETGGIYEKD